MTDELKKDKVLDNEKADMSDSFMARQIVQEILNFGVSQSQMLKVIQILSLELEDRDLMLKIDNLIESKNMGEGDTSQKTEVKSLITKI
tara:strand:- start:264 stop:530 length:267 start_codon:yes stop_codon:yes gene_type:complete